jgi:hypothetical protein
MRISGLLATQRILLINYVIAPALGIWIWIKNGFFIAALFVVIWLIADKAWDWLTGLMITGAGRIGANEHEASQMEISGEVPERMAFMMIVDLLGTFLLPWVVAGFFLVWFGTAKNSLPNTSTYPATEQLTQTSTNPVLEQLTQNKWWLAEYPALIEAVEKADSNQLSTSYAVLADGNSKVELLLSKMPDTGFILTMKLPKGVQSSIVLNTGEKVQSDVAPTIIIRDHNLDGLPDDFQIEPSGQPLYKEKVTDDGFIIYRDVPEHHVILAQWAIGIGYSINYFLHGS